MYYCSLNTKGMSGLKIRKFRFVKKKVTLFLCTFFIFQPNNGILTQTFL